MQSSFPATSDLDLGIAPSLSKFLSGSNRGSGHEDRSGLFTRIASTDSAIEQTLAMSMTAPLPVLPLRKLLSSSSVAAEQTSEQGVANSINDNPMKTEQGDNDGK